MAKSTKPKHFGPECKTYSALQFNDQKLIKAQNIALHCHLFATNITIAQKDEIFSFHRFPKLSENCFLSLIKTKIKLPFLKVLFSKKKFANHFQL